MKWVSIICRNFYIHFFNNGVHLQNIVCIQIFSLQLTRNSFFIPTGTHFKTRVQLAEQSLIYLKIQNLLIPIWNFKNKPFFIKF